MSSVASFPTPGEEESGAEYWERVRQLDRPFPWDTDKSLPPGPVIILEEWATRDSNGDYWPGDEGVVRMAAAKTGSTVVRQIRWRSTGPWEAEE